VWIEDADGNHVKTLYATRWTANGGYKTRPTSIPLWVEKSGAAEWEKPDVDAVSSATPNSKLMSFYWAFGDDNFPDGEYKFFVEGTLRWDNHVVYSGVFNVGGDAGEIEMQAEYIYRALDGNPALTADSPENAMISNVKGVMTY